MKINVKRGMQTFEVPIMLSAQPNSTLAMLALAVPTTLVLAIKVRSTRSSTPFTQP